MPNLDTLSNAVEFIGDAPRELSEKMLMLAQQLSAIHGRIRVAKESSGIHFYMASPACLIQDGADELWKMHLAVNVDKWFSEDGDDKENDSCGFCMKTSTPYRMNDLLSMPPLSERGYPDVKAEVIQQDVNVLFLEPDGKGNMIPRSPGKVIPVFLLPPDHPAQWYLKQRKFDPIKLYQQFRLSWCEEEDHDQFYRNLPGGFKATPQGRIIFYIDVKGVNRGWQGRVLEHETDTKKFFYHPYLKGWQEVMQRFSRNGEWYPLPAFSGWDMPKYFIGRGARRNHCLLGYDAAVTWNRYHKPAKRYCVLTEGPLDAGRVGPPGIALMGKYISDEQAQLLVDAFERVIYVADNDKPGQQAKDKLTGKIGLKYPALELRFMDIPNGPEKYNDLGSMREEDAQALLASILSQ